MRHLKTILLWALYIGAISDMHAQITYRNTGALGTARWCHQAQVMTDGRVIVFGGDNCLFSAFDALNSAEIYDPATKKWTTASPMNEKRTDLASVLLSDGLVMAIGGNDTDNNDLSTCEIYDPSTQKWSYTQPMLQAKRDPQAIMLSNGKVLVADKLSAEIYDPATDRWDRTAPYLSLTNVSSLVKMPNGNILAIGGTKSELFDPATETWKSCSSLTNSRDAAGTAALLKDGSVLVAGSTEVNYDQQLTAEIFRPNSRFAPTSALATYSGNSRLVAMDNGNALLFGLGNFFAPTNTGCFQIYSTAENKWTSPVTNFIGASMSYISKLHDGTFLITGGSATTMNGASSVCWIVGQSGYTANQPDLSLSVAVSPICYGKDAAITVAATESGVSYQACSIDGSPIGAATAGGGDISISVPAKYIAPGKNIFYIKATKSGALPAFLNASALVAADYKYTEQVKVDSSGYLSLCTGTSVMLTFKDTYSSYKWNTDETTSALTVSKAGNYTATGYDATGCAYRPSAPVAVSMVPASVSVLSSQSICFNASPVQLERPVISGIWSGQGVTPQGLFDPTAVPAATYALSYTYCGTVLKTSMTVMPPVKASPFDEYLTYDTICYPGYTKLVMKNTSNNDRYNVSINGYEMMPWKSGGAALIEQRIDAYNASNLIYIDITSVRLSACGSDTLRKRDSLFVDVLNRNSTFTSADTVCQGIDFVMTVTNSRPTVTYWIEYYQGKSAEVKGTGGTISLRCTDASHKYVLYGRNSVGCVGELYTHRPYVFQHQVAIDAPYSVLKDAPVQIINNSNSDSFQWSFDPAAPLTDLKTKNLPAFAFDATGAKNIELTGASRFGCVAKASRQIEVFEKIAPAATSASACLLTGIDMKGRSVTAVCTDDAGNLYVAAYNHLAYHGCGYSGSYYASVCKYDKSGTLLWEKAQDFFDDGYTDKYCCTFITSITCDKTGNVYVGGYFASNNMKFAGLEVKYSTAQNSSFIAKLDNNGTGKWIVAQDKGTEAETSTVGLAYIDDTHIYAAVSQASSLKFTNKSVTDFSYYSITIIQFDSDGNSSDTYQLNGVFDDMSRNMSNLARYVPMSPIMRVMPNGKLLITGQVKSDLQAGTYTLSFSKGTTLGFAAVLNPASGWETAFKTYSSTNTESLYRFKELSAVSADSKSIYVARTLFQSSGSSPIGVKFTDGTERTAISNASFIAKYSLDGTLQWKQFVPQSAIFGLEYSTSTGGIISLHEYEKNYLGLPSQDGHVYAQSGDAGYCNIALAATDPSGNVQWMEKAGKFTMLNSAYVRTLPTMTMNSCSDLCLVGYGNERFSILGNEYKPGSAPYYYARVSLSGACTSICNAGLKPDIRCAVFSNLPLTSNTVPYPVQVSFTSPVTGFTATDVTVTGGSVSSITGSGADYQVMITPTVGGTGEFTVAVPASAATAADGRANLASLPLKVLIDTKKPVITISSTSTSINNAAPNTLITATIAFSEKVTKTLSQSDLTLVNCYVESIDAANGKITLKPAKEGEFSFAVTGAGFTDVAGNKADDAYSQKYSYDLISPTMLADKCSQTVYTAQPTTGDLKFVFNEKVQYFLLRNLTPATAKYTGPVDDTIYYANVSFPSTGTYSFSVESYYDMADNLGSTSCNMTYVYDNVAPTIGVIKIMYNGLMEEGLMKMYLTFSESVKDFNVQDLIVTNADIVTSSRSNANPFEFTLKPKAEGPVTVKVAARTFTDMAGNENATESALFSYNYQKLKPVITTTAKDYTKSSFTLNITFNEPVYDFTVADIIASNAAVVGFSGSGTTFTATVTPKTVGPVTVQIPKAAAYSQSFKQYSAASELFYIYYDNVAPTCTITSSPTDPIRKESGVPVTGVFSEPMLNFSQASLVLANAVISDFQYSGETFSFILYPADLGEFSFSFGATVTDLAGNAVSARPATFLYKGSDNVRPTARIVPMKSVTNSTIGFVIYFSEKVLKSSISISCTNGYANVPARINDSVYSVTVSSARAGVVGVYLKESYYQDWVKNPGIATDTAYMLYDNAGPRPAFTPYESDTVAHKYVRYKAVFNETVGSFTPGSITSSYGTVKNLTGSGTEFFFDFEFNTPPAKCGTLLLAISPKSFKDTLGNSCTYFDPYSYCFPSELVTVPSVTQPISLDAGWNLICVNVKATDMRIRTLFPNATEAKTSDKFFNTQIDAMFSGFTEIETGRAYLVYNLISETINISGTQAVSAFPATFPAGWSMVGVPAGSPLPMNSLPANVQSVKNFKNSYIRSNTVNSLNQLSPNEAYFIFAK